MIILINGLIKYIKDDRFSLFLKNNSLNIVNFDKIVILEDEKIVVMVDSKKIIVRGSNLSINKLLDREMLIMGSFNSIELGE